MKLLRWLIPLLLIASPAIAQWQVPDHAVPIGRGVGITGFKSAAPGASGTALISNGASSDPTFQSVAIGTITGMATNCPAWLATATSANLRACLTDETGTGVAVFANAPTFGTGVTTFSDTTNSTSSTTGSVLFSGGLGVAKDIWMGDNHFLSIGSASPAASSLNFLTINGPTSGSGGGGFLQLDLGGLFAFGWGNASASGGAFDATTTFTSNRNFRAIVSGTGTTPVTNTLIGIWNSDSSGNVTGVVPASGINTWIATPSSANLRAALTDETGTGAAVFATSPALVTPTGIVASDIGNNGFLNVKLTAVNFNSGNTDNAVSVTLPTGYARYQLFRGWISHCSATATTTTFGVFTATGAGGTALVATGTAVTVNTAAENTANNTQSMTFAVGASGGTTSVNFTGATAFYFRVQTPQGSAVTCDVTFQIEPVS